MCAEEDRYIQFMAARAQPPPLTSGDTLHWDGGDAIAPGVALTQGSEPGACAVLPVHRQLATGGRASPMRADEASGPPPLAPSAGD